MSEAKPVIGVGVVILRAAEDGPEVVLIRQGRGLRTGQWTIPGGKQEPGETVRACAAREAREETGLEIEVVDLLDVLDLIGPARDGSGGYHYTLIDFSARAVSGALRAGDDADEARWVAVDEAVALVEWDETRRILRLAADRFGR